MSTPSFFYCFLLVCFGVEMAQRTNEKRNSSLPPISWRAILHDYQLSLEAYNRSPKTLSWYLAILNRFFGFLESNNLLKPIPQLARGELTEYTHYLKNSKRWPNREHNGKDLGRLSESAVQGHVRAVKAFWGWLTREEYIEKNVLSKYPLPAVSKYIIPTLSIEQFDRLLAVIDKNTALGAKYYCILLLLLDTGMRISELVNIKMSGMDFGNGWVTVLGKGRKQRICPFDRFAKKALVRYIKNFRNRLSDLDSVYLFPAADGDHISINGVQQYMRRLAKQVGIDRLRVYPHIFRHTFATRAFENEANVYAVKEILGHSCLQTTQKYTHPQPSDLKKQHNRFSPVAKQMGNKS